MVDVDFACEHCHAGPSEPHADWCPDGEEENEDCPECHERGGEHHPECSVVYDPTDHDRAYDAWKDGDLY